MSDMSGQKPPEEELKAPDVKSGMRLSLIKFIQDHEQEEVKEADSIMIEEEKSQTPTPPRVITPPQVIDNNEIMDNVINFDCSVQKSTSKDAQTVLGSIKRDDLDN